MLLLLLGGSLLLDEFSLIQVGCLSNALVLLLWGVVEASLDLAVVSLSTGLSERLSEDILGFNSWNVACIA